MEMNEAKMEIARKGLNGDMKMHDALESILREGTHAERNEIFQNALKREGMKPHYIRVAVKEDGHAEIVNKKMWERIYKELSEEEAKKILKHLLEKQETK